ncbi:MAG: NUDIX domain-containing protein [Planctomycetota bacterium]|nr:NUDIX domain-containing protein [Planctomycetota bacterium]
MPQTPPIEIIARGLLWRGGHLLLCQNVQAGYCYLPGGHVEFNEPADAACAREFAEETGLKVTPGACRLVAEVRFEDARARRHHELNLVFHVEHATPLPDEIPSREPQIAFLWAEPAQIVDLDVRPAAIKAWLLAGDAETSHPGPIWISSAE